MQYPTLLESLGTYLHLPKIVPDNAQRVALRMDGVHVIFTPAWPEPDRLQLKACAALGFSDGRDSALTEELLAANLLGRGTGGAFIALDNGDHITLNMQWCLQSLPFSRFCELLDGFVAHAGYWKNIVGDEVTPARGVTRAALFDGMRA